MPAAASRPAVDRRRGDDEPGERRANEDRRLGGPLDDAVGALQLVRLDELRDDRGLRREEEGVGDPEHERERVEHPELGLAREHDGTEGADRDQADGVGPEHHAPRREAVDRHAADQHQQGRGTAITAMTLPRASALPVRTSASHGSAMRANWSPRLETASPSQRRRKSRTAKGCASGRGHARGSASWSGSLSLAAGLSRPAIEGRAAGGGVAAEVRAERPAERASAWPAGRGLRGALPGDAGLGCVGGARRGGGPG